MFCEDYSWLKNVQFPTLRCLPEALPGKYLTLGTVWPFPFRGSPLGLRDSISSASVIHLPFKFLYENLLFYPLTNQLHVINSFPSPSSVVCSACQEFFTPTHPLRANVFEFDSHGQFLTAYIFFSSQRRLLKWFPDKSFFHALRFSYSPFFFYSQFTCQVFYIIDFKVLFCFCF